MHKNRSKSKAKRTVRATPVQQTVRARTSVTSSLSQTSIRAPSTSSSAQPVQTFGRSIQTATSSRRASSSAVVSRRTFANSFDTAKTPSFALKSDASPVTIRKAHVATVPTQAPVINAPSFSNKQAIAPKLQVSQPKIRPFSTKSEEVPDNGVADGPGGIKRPISPSIQIWKFTPTAYAHVGVRIAGAVLTGGFTLAGLTALFGTCDIPHLLDQVKIHTPILVPLLKASIVAPTVYHTLGGFRQLYQDFTAKGYSFKFQEQSSIGIAVLTLLSTLYFGAI